MNVIFLKINNRLTNFSENDFENIHEISNSHKFIESFNIWDLSTLIKDGKIIRTETGATTIDA